MAIDTRAKRQNAAWIGFPGPVSVLPVGAITQAARQQISWGYLGILVPTPPPVGAGDGSRLLLWVGS